MSAKCTAERTAAITTTLLYRPEFWDQINSNGACWEWTGPIYSTGYGRYRERLTHRLVYEALIGPIPKRYDIDHQCRNRKCANPEHLEAVTHAENARRGMAGINHRNKTECPKGHPYDAANTRTTEGRRRCRECCMAAAKKYRADKKAGRCNA